MMRLKSWREALMLVFWHGATEFDRGSALQLRPSEEKHTFLKADMSCV